MAEEFEALGYKFKTIDGKDNEVALCAVDKNASGKIILPKMVEHKATGKFYIISTISSKVVKTHCSSYTTGILTFPKGLEDEVINVTEIVIPSSVKEIKDEAFKYNRLTAIKLPEGLASIGKETFSYCYDLVSLEIPSTVKSIGESAFSHCEKLCKIKLPIEIKKISDDTFYSCKALSEISIPRSVTIIGKCAFKYCAALTTIDIPSSVEIIEQQAFLNCDNLAQVDIYNDEGEVTIASNAFPANAKINYLGKKGAQKSAAPEMAANLSPKHTEEKKDSSPKPDKVKETAASQPTKKNEVSVPKPTKSVQEIKEEPNASSKLANDAQNDYKKSAEFEDYIINITEDKKVIVTKDGEVCEVTKVALREIAGKAGFNYDSEWTTQQFGRKLVAFLNEK